MLTFIERVARFLAIPLFLSAALAQPKDVSSWNGVPWGSPKSAVLAALASLHVHSCPACGPDELIIDDYTLNGLSYRVALVFLPRFGFAGVRMTAADGRASFQRVLADLTAGYGRPGLRSEYDGDREVTRTTWEWTKPHGKLSLSSDDGDGASEQFVITYEARRQ